MNFILDFIFLSHFQLFCLILKVVLRKSIVPRVSLKLNEASPFEDIKLFFETNSQKTKLVTGIWFSAIFWSLLCLLMKCLGQN